VGRFNKEIETVKETINALRLTNNLDENGGGYFRIGSFVGGEAASYLKKALCKFTLEHQHEIIQLAISTAENDLQDGIQEVIKSIAYNASPLPETNEGETPRATSPNEKVQCYAPRAKY
jgi:hypothetical protein